MWNIGVILWSCCVWRMQMRSHLSKSTALSPVRFLFFLKWNIPEAILNNCNGNQRNSCTIIRLGGGMAVRVAEKGNQPTGDIDRHSFRNRPVWRKPPCKSSYWGRLSGTHKKWREYNLEEWTYKHGFQQLPKCSGKGERMKEAYCDSIGGTSSTEIVMAWGDCTNQRSWCMLC